MKLLILNKTNCTSTANNNYTWRFSNEPIRDVKTIEIQKATISTTSKPKEIYMRSNLSQLFNDYVIASTSGSNRHSNIIGILSNNESGVDDTQISSDTTETHTASPAQLLELDSDIDEHIYSGKSIYRLTDAGGISGNTGTGDFRSATFRARSNKTWNIKIISRSTGSDKLEIFEQPDGTQDFVIFSESGSGTNEELISVYSNITFEFDPSTDQTGFDIVVYESGSSLTYDAGTDTYSATTTTTTNPKAITYFDLTPIEFTNGASQNAIKDIELTFHDSVNSRTNLSIEHFNIILKIK